MFFRILITLAISAAVVAIDSVPYELDPRTVQDPVSKPRGCFKETCSYNSGGIKQCDIVPITYTPAASRSPGDIAQTNNCYATSTLPCPRTIRLPILLRERRIRINVVARGG
ncbi:hypothetical protein BDW02DRAFT_647804 [Decorospora gaudefroyi]|uniref:Uncharacterized protein n=1 Tax=Decorospora gaudefroyi TaxID=184978 RepID=A0A6A5KG13_9PLEO|nr:hypothetical protein BDW02DRAFT_647804 [Decorospora gaudefroyi]